MSDLNRKLSRNFKLKELVCPCCGQGEQYISPLLVTALQEFRDFIGVPIHVLSGYRCPKHNKSIGGAEHSKHLKGIAADITFSLPSFLDMPKAIAMYFLAEEIHDFCNGGIGIYLDQNSIHVDVREQRARWVKTENIVHEDVIYYNSIFEWISPRKNNK